MATTKKSPEGLLENTVSETFQYAARMTPAQKRRLGAVFGRYNVNMTK